jgi:formylglycine-generating enzyme required for sulfatase activity
MHPRLFLACVVAHSCVEAADIESTPRHNIRVDQYTSRLDFLRDAAEFETERLKAMPFRADGEDIVFKRNSFDVALEGKLAIHFIKIGAGTYTDGMTAALKAEILAVPNRAGDMNRWADTLDTTARGKVTVPYDFFMSETIVSNAMFAAFVRDTAYQTCVERLATGWIVTPAAQWRQGFASNWREQIAPSSAPDHPVVQVCWFDAMAFAQWISTKCGVVCRVPTKEEWLLAARPADSGNDQRLFPWGNSFDGIERRMNFGSAELNYSWVHDQYRDGYPRSSPVTAFAANARGLHDMLGNVWVWNWTNQAAYEHRPVGDRAARPASLADLATQRNEPMAMQGGCYLARLTHAQLLSKMAHPALDGAEDIGFRLVAVRHADSGLPGAMASTN